jgi:chromosome segregation ATPase
MSELKAAADHVRHLAKSYASVIRLGEALNTIGDIESHTKELERQRDNAQKALDQVMVQISDAKTAVGLQQAKVSAQAALDQIINDTRGARDALADVKAAHEVETVRLAELKEEAGTVEKQLTALKADLAALKARLS